jgi:hypothetical protein
MTGIPPLSGTGSDAAPRTADRATVAIAKALQEKRKDAAAMVRLIEAADASGKGRHVDYRA